MEGSSPCVCVQIISKEENRGMKTTEQLKERGVPVNKDKFKWSSSAVKDLEQIVKLLSKNQENPPRPKGKSVFKYIKEKICSGLGPSEEQIKKKLHSMNYFSQ